MKKIFVCAALAGMLFSACGNSSTQTTAANISADSGATATAPVSNDPGATSATNAPTMKFERETHDFGKIKAGDKVTYEFKFTNTGKSPLIIKDAVATCGCTKPEWPTTPIAPGADGAIKVTFNSVGKMGLQDKQITVTANTNPAQNMVHLIGEVTVQ